MTGVFFSCIYFTPLFCSAHRNILFSESLRSSCFRFLKPSMGENERRMRALDRKEQKSSSGGTAVKEKGVSFPSPPYPRPVY